MEPQSSSVTVPQAPGGKSRSPVVSVCCATFNHRQYLQQALDGFLMQQTSFPFEVIVHDDASTDGTADIVREYALRHPSVFRPILQAENQYQRRVRIVTIMLPQARGKYIALCEGDDYWTDPSKLQRQVDFLEAQRNYSGCFHPVPYIDAQGTPTGITHPSPTPVAVQYVDMCQTNWVQTCSLVFRKEAVPNLPDWFNKLPLGDWPLCLLLTKWGQLGVIDRPMAHYRVHPGGVWSSTSEFIRLERQLEMSHILLEQPELDRSPIYGLHANICMRIACLIEEQGDRTAAINLLADAFRSKMFCNPTTGLAECVEHACAHLIYHRLHETQAELQAIKQSRAWRVTAPLRAFAKLLQDTRIKYGLK